MTPLSDSFVPYISHDGTDDINGQDDPGNLCHAGFLRVARQMVRPVAQRLRQLLDEAPARASYSLLITGHSAGGAIASLLYCHMLATSGSAASELNALAGRFRRIHCITFGTPPTSLLPLAKPLRWNVRSRQYSNREDDKKDPGRGDGGEDGIWSERRLRKSLFMTFVNEGDPVARVDKAYLRSLLELFASPAPSNGRINATAGKASARTHSAEKGRIPGAGSSKSSDGSMADGDARQKPKHRSDGPVWQLPACELSVPGRVVVLRLGTHGKTRTRDTARCGMTIEERLNEGVIAQVATDEQLRGLVWGDPVCHTMRLYAGRVETLAVGAVTAQTS